MGMFMRWSNTGWIVFSEGSMGSATLGDRFGNLVDLTRGECVRVGLVDLTFKLCAEIEFSGIGNLENQSMRLKTSPHSCTSWTQVPHSTFKYLHSCANFTTPSLVP